jgi:hypothetical protein
MVEFLLRRGARPRLPDDPPWATPLAWAIRRGHDAIAQLLKQHEQDGSLPARPLEQYESLAKDLIEAYGSGDAGSLRRLEEHFQPDRAITWEQLRRNTRQRLGKPGESENESEPLALGEAQLLIARWHGFETWSELTKHGG